MFTTIAFGRQTQDGAVRDLSTDTVCRPVVSLSTIVVVASRGSLSTFGGALLVLCLFPSLHISLPTISVVPY